MDEFQEVIFVAEWKRLTTMKQKNSIIREVFDLMHPSVHYQQGGSVVRKGSNIPAVKRCLKFLSLAMQECPTNNLPMYIKATIHTFTKELQC